MNAERQGQDAASSLTKQKRKRAVAVKLTEPVAAKRRNQNRLSQQEHRRKQHAYIRSMESFINAVKDNTGAQGEESRYNKLLKAHTELIEENRRLEGMLHRMRRKLLSFANQLDFTTGSTSVPAAETNDTSIPSEVSSNASSTATMQVRSISNVGLADLKEKFLPLNAPSELQSPEITVHPGNSMRTFAAETDVEPFVALADRDPNETVELPWILDTCPGDIFSDFAKNIFDDPLLNNPPLYAQPWPFPTPSCQTTLSSATVFADQIIIAAKKLTMQSGNLAVGGLKSTSDKIGYDVAAAAVQVMGSLAGLETYIYPTHFSTYLEDVIRWRISPSPKDLLAVPEPFRPTPLQRKIADHPAVIDFINWPSIRDQMLTHSEYLDLDAMCRDVVLNTVVDLHRFGCSVNIHDLLFNHVLPRVKGVELTSGDQSMLHKASWIYLQVGQADARAITSADETSTDDELVRRISTRMSSQYSTEANTLTALSPGASPMGSSSQVDGQSLTALLSSFNVHEISQWRLGRDFARRYPYIDCSSVISDFETVSCKTEAFRSKITDPPSYTI